METLPFREGVFDLTFGAAAIHHSCDLRRTVRELARVTRLGRPVVTIKDHLRPAYLSLEEWLEGDLDSSRGIHERSFNYLDYTEAFRAAGLRPEVRPSRHYWSEQAHGASVGAHIGRSYPVLLYHALRFWLGSYVIIDIVGRKVKPRPRGERAFSLRRALNRRGLFTLLFRLFAPQKKGGIEREKLLYIARVQAPSSVVRREMVYQVEVASNSAERRRVQLAYDLYPLANGRHPDRHVGWWAKNIDLEPGEKKRLQVKFSPEYMQAVFRLAGSYERADSSWLGDYYQANRFYKTGFFLYDEQGEQVHGYVLLQRFLA